MIRTATAPHLSRLPGRTRRHWLVAAAEMAGLASGNAWSSPDSALRGRPRLPRVAVRSLGADAESVRAARNFTMATLCRWDTAQRSQDVVIVVSELLTNALRHALPAVGQARFRRPVQLGLLQLGHCVLCAVADPGQAAPAPRTPGSLDQTGRGLSIICALSDQWGYTTPSEAGKVVWATFYSRLTASSLTMPPHPCDNVTHGVQSQELNGPSWTEVPGFVLYPVCRNLSLRHFGRGS